jgi:hypothetical protein
MPVLVKHYLRLALIAATPVFVALMLNYLWGTNNHREVWFWILLAIFSAVHLFVRREKKEKSESGKVNEHNDNADPKGK